ncbi:hypothetical protein [Burkholderia gladioli]|uniref:Uncharacterized protein n=1 Tax=Burkholderia gladioli (strain BSR3) TaxID=999541 RepID=F2LLH4_BURGS|nr:hypothetical protein [Burkholderia gladioli]AEA63591.1 hypothetical protein bgla_2g11420 [Burkholderia gladioli BSR3]MBW5282103.1 hypothetical protein [Burkholderia gladioli]
MSVENWKYDDFVVANNGKFSVLDFIHAVFAQAPLPEDIVLCMGRLFSPNMVMHEGVIVVADWFDGAKYKEYRDSGMSPSQVQPWINMVELTDIFKGMSVEGANKLASIIADLWRNKIKRDFPESEAEVMIVLEADLGEVFVTIGEYGLG